MKALVTGCAGFIGSHLTERLLRDNLEVVGIDCFTNYYPRDIKEKNIAQALKDADFELIEADILDMQEFPQVDYIFHSAAQPGIRASWGKDFEIYVRNNILVTQKLLESYKNRDIKKFIYASSSSIYGNARLPLKEDMPPRPISPYGVTKLASENLCYLYYVNYGVPVISLRYFNVYGPRQRPDMAIHRFVPAISNGKEVLIFGDGNQTRDFIYVDDIVEANILAARSNNKGKVFNIGSGNRISVNELIKLISETLNQEARVSYVEEQKGDVHHTRAHIAEAQAKLGWRPRISIADGVKKYVDSIVPGL